MPAAMTLGGIPLKVNPTDVRWSFVMKTTDQKTMGGKVIQILGTRLEDIVIQGSFGGGRRDLGETESWEAQLRFREQVDKWAEQGVSSANAKRSGLRFTYSPHNWDFLVYVKNFSIAEQTVESINLPWTLTLFPLDERAWKIVRGIKDLYVKRLMDGIGWKQTEMNGPTQAEVDTMLGGRSMDQYIAEEMGQAFLGGSGGATIGGPGGMGRPGDLGGLL